MRHKQTQEQIELAAKMRAALARESLKYLSYDDPNTPHLNSTFKVETLRIIEVK